VYLTYIDESGKPERTHPENEFVLAALSINESEWKRMDRSVTGLKQKYFPDRDPESVEFHTSEIIHHRGVFKPLSLETRLMIIEDLLKVVSEIDCHISSVVVYKDKITNPESDIGMFSMRPLFECLCRFHDHANSENADDDEEYGILLIDSVDKKYDNKLRVKVRGLCQKGSGRIKNRYLIEDPIFVESKYRHMSQLADCVAYCIRKKFRSGPGDPLDTETFEKFYGIIEKRISGCKGCGIKLFP